ncbi:hypothetical protein LCGC14_2174230 [marine sediment metagenome]|uniref:Uncharacterized protein n=1 Tax=marine sediment metagenome TaxID=412755 RepID=A0A0F9GJZ8_9ZZZZ
MQMDKINVGSLVDAKMTRGREQIQSFDPRGEFYAEHWRDGKLLSRQKFPNGITDEGKAKIFDLYFDEDDTTVPQDAYIGLINWPGSTPTLLAADTYTTHAGWTEFTAYKVAADGTKRAEWDADASTGAGTVSISNASPATFDFDANGDVYGIFVVTGLTAEIELQSNVTAGNILWAHGGLATEIAVVSGDQLKITYTVNA